MRTIAGGNTMSIETNSQCHVKAEELSRRIKEIIHEGNVRRIIIKDAKGATYLEIPLAIGVVGVLIAPVLAAAAALAAVASSFTIEVERRQPEEAANA
jgi:hypothetical protein